MNRNIETIVYHDDRYPSSWISDRDGYPDRITQYLRSKGLEVMNADELRKFMIDSIQKGNAHEKLVVFSQDVIPDTIAEEYWSNTTLREFLDPGGSILWIGIFQYSI